MAKKLKIKFLRAMAGASCSFRKNKEYLVDEKWAKAIVKGGNAVLVDEPKKTGKAK